jgi:hypothetical protein
MNPMKSTSMLCCHIAGIIVFCSSCDKDPTRSGLQLKKPKPVNIKFTLGEARDYLWGRPGSYWIYKDSATGTLDTQVVTEMQFNTQVVRGATEKTKHMTVEFDKLKRVVYSSFHQKSFTDETPDSSPDQPFFNGTFRAVLMRTGAGRFVPFFHPFKMNAWGGGATSTFTYCIGIDTAFQIQNKPYAHICMFETYIDYSWTNTPPYFLGTYYWAKDIGLIKTVYEKEIRENWELIEYNIVQ